jgi:serine phosphatase RsbU (regulator of sigma subunit)
VLQPEIGKVLVAGAGHPPVLVIRQDGRVEPLASSAPPIGVLSEAKIEALPAQLVDGDTLLLYTDGLTSLPGKDGQRLTFTTLFKALRGTKHGKAREVLDFVLGIVREIAGGCELFTDDLAAVAICFGEKKETHS